MLEYQFWEFVWECKFLFEKGYEVEETKGLGFPGWRSKSLWILMKRFLIWVGINYISTQNHPILLKYIHENDDVYFVHSFMATCPNDDNLIAYSDYG